MRRRRLCLPIFSALFVLAVLQASAVFAGTTITRTLFGPERFNYSSSTYTRTFSCPSTQGSFTLTVVNGDGHDDHFASSTVIKVNNTQVVGTGDLGHSTRQVSKSVTNLVNGNNTLTVKVNGHSGDYLTVTINGVYTLDVKITAPTAGALIADNHVQVQGTYLAYSSNFDIKVDNVTASAGGGSFNVPSVPLISGSNRLQAVITTNDGLTDQDNVTVNGNIPPIAEAGPAQNVRAGDNVYLDGRGSSDPENAPITYLWSFTAKPTGSQSALSGATTVSPAFIPDLPGAYTVQLVVNDGVQNSVPDNILVTAVLPNTPPTAIAGADQNVTAGDRVFLDGSGSFDPDSDPLYYSWNLIAKPQVSQAELSNPAIANPTIDADASGVYVAQLTVNDGLADSGPDNVTIVAVPPNTPPTAVAGSDGIVPRNRVAFLDGSGSFDPEGNMPTYSWTLVSRPPGSLSTLDNATSAFPSFAPDLQGDYVFRLVVNDGVFDSPPDTVVVTAVNVPPVAAASAASTDVPINTLVSLDGSGSHDDNGDALSYAWTLVAAPAGSAAVLSQPTSAYPAITPDVAGSYTIRLSVNDGQAESAFATVVVTSYVPPVNVPSVVGLTQAAAQEAITGGGLAVGSVTVASSDTVPSGNVIAQEPTGGTMAAPGSSVNLTVSTGPLMVPVPVVLGMTQGEAQSALSAAQLGAGNITNAWSGTVAQGRVISQDPKSGTVLLHGSSVALVVSQGPEPVVIPPDPATVAPAPDKTVSSSVDSMARFLYTGPNSIQTGVQTGTIDPKRVTVIRGSVKDPQGVALPGVSISVALHPEFGKTVTRLDGMFDMAVNGGGMLTVAYDKPGYVTAHRQVAPVWQEYALAPEVVLVPFDNQVTTIDLSASIPVQAAAGSTTSDERGVRKATVLIPQATTMDAVFDNGVTRPMTIASIRATELTVGPEGEKRMPAPLPPTTAYTYAVDLSVDEASAAGAAGVSFSNPVYVYVENFLGFPVGGIVPAGYYDPQKMAWVPSANGKIIKVVGVTSGKADVDSDGDDLADAPAVLANIGMVDSEREKIAGLYPVGQSLWRVPITHFSPWDLNWPYRLDNNAKNEGGTPITQPPKRRDCKTNGSIILCNSRVLGETVPIAGTPFSLNYRSDRGPGVANTNKIFIPLSDNTPLLESLVRIEWEVVIGGRSYTGSIVPAIDCSVTFEWDGLGPYGHPLIGLQHARVKVGYVYTANYFMPPDIANAFGISSTVPISGFSATTQRTLLKEWVVSTGNWDARVQGLGGWTLDVNHAYDPIGQTLFMGDGETINVSDVNRVVDTTSGGGQLQPGIDGKPGKSLRLDYANGVAVEPDGSVLILESMQSILLRQSPDGIARIIAGRAYDPGYSGDGGPAISARLSNPAGVAVGPDGSIYIADQSNNRIRKIDPATGIISTVAGNGTAGYAGDGGPAVDAQLDTPFKVVVDPSGNLYVSEMYNGVIRKVDASGTISTVAGKRRNCIPGSSSALEACIGAPIGLALGLPNSGVLLYSSSLHGNVKKIGTDGSIADVAGIVGNGFSGDGGPATEAMFNSPQGLAVSPDGTLYVADTWNKRIRRITRDGVIDTFAGSGDWGHDGDGGAASQATIFYPTDVTVAPDGAIYFTDAYANSYGGDRIRRVSTPMPGFSGTEIALPSKDGSLLYRFDRDGKHLSTINSLTGSTMLQFSYEPNGWLREIRDGYQNVTEIRRQPTGNGPSVDNIIAPGGQITRLGLAENYGSTPYLAYVEKPSGDRYYVSMNPSNGLLDSVIDWRGNSHVFRYGADGLLEQDDDPAGGYKRLELKTDYATVEFGDLTLKNPKISGFGWVYGVPVVDGAIFEVRQASRLADSMPVSASKLLSDVAAENPVSPGGRIEWEPGLPPKYVAETAPSATYVESNVVEPYPEFIGCPAFPPITPEAISRSTVISTAEGRQTYYTKSLTGKGVDLSVTQPSGYRAYSNKQDDAGTSVTWDTEAMSRSTTVGPDPRFGMQVPFDKDQVISSLLPQAQVWRPNRENLANGSWATNKYFQMTTSSKAVVLADPDDPLSLLSMTDNVWINNRMFSTVYDNAALKFTTRSAVGRTSTAYINVLGQVVSSKADPAILPTEIRYDVKGRLSQAGQDNNDWFYGYDDANLLRTVTDPLGRVTHYGYDNNDRVDRIELPSGRTYRFRFDGAGNRTKVIMPNRNEHLLGYSPVDLDNSYLPPENPSYSHEYSLDRELKRTVLPSGRTIVAEYDNVTGLPVSTTWPEATVSFGFRAGSEKLRHLSRKSLPDNTDQSIDFDYDLGILVKRNAFSGVSTGEYRYAYDNNFFRTGIALDNVWTMLAYDDDGLLTGHGPFTVTRSGPGGTASAISDLNARQCGVDNTGLPIPSTAGTFLQEYGFDNVGRLNRRTVSVNGAVVYEETLDRNKLGGIARKTERTSTGTQVGYRYAYDLDGQLDNVVLDSAPETIYEKFVYDNNGNMTDRIGPGINRSGITFDSQDREIGGNLVFDVDGFMSRRGNRNYRYSAKGELLAVIDNATGSTIVSYAYDGTNRRVAKIDPEGLTTQYLYGNLDQPFQITASRAPDNVVLTTYFYDTMGALYALERSGIRYYVAADHLGTPKAVFDNTGNLLDSMAYDSYGMRISGGGAFDLPVGYAGGLIDNASTLVRFGFRDYEPESGRWASKDPIFHRGGLNLYQYVSNDPVNRKDPRGEFWHVVGGALLGGLLNGFNNYNHGESFWKGFGVGAVAGGVGALTGNPWLAGGIAGGLTTGGNIATGSEKTDGLADTLGKVGVGAVEGAVAGGLFGIAGEGMAPEAGALGSSVGGIAGSLWLQNGKDLIGFFNQVEINQCPGK
jgi:RHS repeat-associated protein